ncbi:C-type lectin domain family 2 member B-like [Anolis sagrei]|uniref:C-type lectin domain family 2 member B-like n=1 Tax=Anolis sagrei TaxID=38937 RepID=UPI0035203D98
MMDSEDPQEAEANNVTHSKGNCGNGSKTADQMAQGNGDCENGLALSEIMGILNGKMNEESDGGWKAKWSKFCTVPVICSLVVSSIIIVVFSVMVTKSSISYPTTIVLACPSGWIGYEGKCYYFSGSETTWNLSQSNCSASGASLVTIEDQKEMDFIMQVKRPTDYWIGLKREKEGQPWKWANGTLFNNWFDIGADGPCAYLNDEKASSTLCWITRNWICGMSARSA